MFSHRVNPKPSVDCYKACCFVSEIHRKTNRFPLSFHPNPENLVFLSNVKKIELNVSLEMKIISLFNSSVQITVKFRSIHHEFIYFVVRKTFRFLILFLSYLFFYNFIKVDFQKQRYS